MPKISAYPEFVEEAAYAIIQDGANNYKVRMDNLLQAAAILPNTAGAFAEEFHDVSNAGHFGYRSAIGAGTLVNGAEENHPGIEVVYTDGANTGMAFWMGNASAILIQGQEEVEVIFRPILVGASIFRFYGFFDTADTVALTDGVCFRVSGSTLVGLTHSGVNQSITATSYTIVTNKWYRGKIIINAAATRVDFYLYDSAGALLWTDNLTTDIPTAAGRETGFGLKAYSTSNLGLVAIDHWDYVSLFLPKVLTR